LVPSVSISISIPSPSFFFACERECFSERKRLRKRLRSCYNSQNDSSNSGVLFRGGFVAAKGAKEVSPMSRIVGVGSVNMDLVMQAPRLPVLGETLAAGPVVTASGGKGANQAVAAARLGASVGMVGRVGDDAFGGTLRLALEQEGVHVEHLLVSPGSSTGVASIFVVEGDNAITIAREPMLCFPHRTCGTPHRFSPMPLVHSSSSKFPPKRSSKGFASPARRACAPFSTRSLDTAFRGSPDADGSFRAEPH
jgi:hypothetical protein